MKTHAAGRRRLVLLALICAIGWTVEARAQVPVPVPSPKALTLSGKVLGPQGAAVPGVSVQVESQATGVSRQVTTDPAGDFRVPGLTPGKYTVTFIAAGFSEVRREVDLSAGEPRPLSVRLSGGPIPIPGPPAGTESITAFQWTLRDANSLEQRLTAKAKDGQGLIAVVGTGAGNSVFVFESQSQAVEVRHLLVRLDEPIRPERLRKELEQQPGKRFVGVHRLTATSYLMVFRDDRR